MSTIKPKQEKIVVVFEKKLLSGLTTNADFFEYADLCKTKFFGKKMTKFIKFLENLEDASMLQKDSLLRDVSIILHANESGCLSVDWDRFFKLSTRSMLSTSKDTIAAIKKYHPNIIKAWDEAMIEVTSKEQNM